MIEAYKELLNSINLHKHYKEVAEEEYKYNKRLFNKNRVMNTRETIENKDIFRIVEDLRHWENMIYLEEEQIKHLEDKKKAIDECINQSDITVKVAALRAMGLTQEQVSELVDKSTRQVQRIEAKLGKCEFDRYICHCTVHAYDGISTLTARPTIIVEATNSADAMNKAERELRNQYEKAKCVVNSVSFPIVKKI